MRKLPEQTIVELENLLKETDKAKPDQLSKLHSIAPGLVEYKTYTASTKTLYIDFYDNKNAALNAKLTEIFGLDYTPLTVHTVNYMKGGEVFEHIDANSYNTFVIMLEDNFNGGIFYLDGKEVDFTTRGDVAHYVGWKQPHSISKVTEGNRKVLVVWYKEKE